MNNIVDENVEAEGFQNHIQVFSEESDSVAQDKCDDASVIEVHKSKLHDLFTKVAKEQEKNFYQKSST